MLKVLNNTAIFILIESCEIKSTMRDVTYTGKQHEENNTSCLINRCR